MGVGDFVAVVERTLVVDVMIAGESEDCAAVAAAEVVAESVGVGGAVDEFAALVAVADVLIGQAVLGRLPMFLLWWKMLQGRPFLPPKGIDRQDREDDALRVYVSTHVCIPDIPISAMVFTGVKDYAHSPYLSWSSYALLPTWLVLLFVSESGDTVWRSHIVVLRQPAEQQRLLPHSWPAK